MEWMEERKQPISIASAQESTNVMQHSTRNPGQDQSKPHQGTSGTHHLHPGPTPRNWWRQWDR